MDRCEGRSCECEKAVCGSERARGCECPCGRGGVCIGESGCGERRGLSVIARSGVRTGCPLLSRGGQVARAGPWTRQGAPRDPRHVQRGFEPGGRQVGAAQPGVGFGGEVRGGGDRTHRGRRRGCPRARGRRAAWRRRVAGKVPGSGGRPAPPRAGPPWCALGPGAPPPHIRAQETADPEPAVPCPAATAAPSPLNLARPGPSPRPAPAQLRLRVASSRPAGRLRLRDSSLPRKATPLGAAAAPPPSHSLPPSRRRRWRKDLPLDLSSKFCPGSDF